MSLPTLTRPARLLAAVAGTAVLWAVLAATLERGLPPGIVLRGSVIGSLYALGAIGIVLVWRGSGIVNFAQVELGSVAALVAIELVMKYDVNYFVALVAGIALAACMGVIISRLVIDRFRSSPRLILTVATIGLTQVLAGLALLVPTWFGEATAGRFTTPFSFTFELDPIRFDGNFITALVAVPVLLVGLSAFLKRSRYGTAIRAVAENEQRASLLGLPTRRLGSLVWAIAAALSAIAVMLRVPILGFASFQGVSGSGNAMLLRILAAAVLARMERLPVAVGAAVGIGIFEEIVSSELSNTNLVDASLVVVILLALLAQRDVFSRMAETGIASWRTVREVRPIPAELRDLPVIRRARALLIAVALVAAVSVPLWSRPSQEQAVSLLFIYGIVAVSLLVLTGWAGQISLGQFALVGIGGGATGVLYARHHWDFLLAVPIGIVASAAAAALVGLPALRVRGPFLAVTTLAFAVTTSTVLLNRDYLTWFDASDVSAPVLWGRFDLRTDWVFYELCLVALLGAVAVARNLRRSRLGRTLVAVRDNEPATATLTINPTLAKLTAFAISGGLAGLAGSLYVVHQNGIFADAFDAEVSIRLFSMVVIGGLTTITGVLLGAGYVRGVEFFLPADVALLASGFGILLLLLVLPEGLGGALFRVRDWLLRLVANRAGIHVPSLVADVAHEGIAPGGAPVAPAISRSEAPGDGSLLSVRALDVSYDQTQVVFGVDLDVRQGEIVALLGTNGAGKSTVIKAVSGVAGTQAGSVSLGGHDLTGATPREVLAAGIALVPGGRGIFPSLTVAENLRIAAWTASDRSRVAEITAEVLEWFPALELRNDTAAGALSGGEQQMLSISMALLADPSFLMIDELSLGLAPVIVDRLVEIVRAVNARGTTVLIVEQSVQVALQLAERAVFLEKGEVRFEGATSELLARDDLLRSVYLHGAKGTGRAKARRRADEAPTAAPVLSCSGLSVAYGGVTALDGIDLALRPGELLGIIGPNGAGKTTLMDALTGFAKLSGGTIRLGAEDVTGMAAHERARLGLGRTFQDARLWPALTVREAVALACERTLVSRDPLSVLVQTPMARSEELRTQARAEELIELVGVGAFADKFVGELSTGSRRMVEIATMLANRPSIILLDEPSSGIAQKEAEALGPVLLDIREQLGASLIVIEHDMGLLASIADRFVALDAGAYVTDGTPAEVLAHPQVVASYLGERATAGAR